MSESIEDQLRRLRIGRRQTKKPAGGNQTQPSNPGTPSGTISSSSTRRDVPIGLRIAQMARKSRPESISSSDRPSAAAPSYDNTPVLHPARDHSQRVGKRKPRWPASLKKARKQLRHKGPVGVDPDDLHDALEAALMADSKPKCDVQPMTEPMDEDAQYTSVLVKHNDELATDLDPASTPIPSMLLSPSLSIWNGTEL